MARLFGTDGVRGIANVELTCDLAYQLGRAGAQVLTQGTHRPSILVGKDTRISGDMLESALVAGICAMGAEALLVGVVPTPAIAYLTRTMEVDAGVMISASHNPMEYNGIKFFNGQGLKLADELEDRIEALVKDDTGLPQFSGEQIGRVKHVETGSVKYMKYLMSLFDLDLKGMRIALDCANGAASSIGPELLKRLGAHVLTICDRPDGININESSGSTHIGTLQSFSTSVQAEVGFSFDGDADRVLAVDHLGNVVDGDKMLYICGMDMKNRGELKGDAVVATVMSNIGLELALQKIGCGLVKTAVGDRYVLEKMQADGYALGGEQSGHIIFLDYNTTGDGILTALMMLRVMKNSQKTLAELAAEMTVFPQVLVSASVANDKKKIFDKDEDIASHISVLEQKYKGCGRVLVRASGTEPIIRVMIEGKNEQEIGQDAEALAKIIEAKLA